MNRWKIPDWLEHKIRKRDKRCVFCRTPMKELRHARGVSRSKATWEHLDNNVRHRTETNIVRCCGACNSSKGAKKLVTWFQSDYCKEKNINARTVSPIVKSWLRRRRGRLARLRR
ncbi:MAG: HNH endonuclease [Acidobacteria bacterium]|nr:MAG: HNH endonuclease [Acidobacteriota bacterium]